MYPYTDPVWSITMLVLVMTLLLNLKKLAKTIICIGLSFSYSHNASDDELDQLTYSWVNH